jgi:hypothetical protein
VTANTLPLSGLRAPRFAERVADSGIGVSFVPRTRNSQEKRLTFALLLIQNRALLGIGTTLSRIVSGKLAKMSRVLRVCLGAFAFVFICPVIAFLTNFWRQLGIESASRDSVIGVDSRPSFRAQVQLFLRREIGQIDGLSRQEVDPHGLPAVPFIRSESSASVTPESETQGGFVHRSAVSLPDGTSQDVVIGHRLDNDGLHVTARLDGADGLTREWSAEVQAGAVGIMNKPRRLAPTTFISAFGGGYLQSVTSSSAVDAKIALSVGPIFDGDDAEPSCHGILGASSAAPQIKAHRAAGHLERLQAATPCRFLWNGREAFPVDIADAVRVIQPPRHPSLLSSAHAARSEMRSPANGYWPSAGHEKAAPVLPFGTILA